MSAEFYSSFEDKFRGSRDVIKSRLCVYLPFIEPLIDLYDEVKTVDLGCGRGEWLELMRDAGFDAQGVDLNDAMLAVCRNTELNVQTGDAIEFLKSLPDASKVIVSGFHFAEHITFSDLQTLVQEALRVLKPAGLLILETPNSENILVGTSDFYLDPSHQHPIPPLLLSFLPEHYGFARVKVLRLQELKLSSKEAPTLFDVFKGVSQDYAIVAQKRVAPEQMKLFDIAFEKNYGLSLAALAQQYEARIVRAEARIERTEAALNQIRSTLLWRTLRWINISIESIKKTLR